MNSMIAVEDRVSVKSTTQEKLVVIPTSSDEILAHAYLRFRQEGLLPDIFPEGETTLTWFLQRLNQLPTLAAFHGPRLAGLGWMNWIIDMGPAGRKGECAIAFFPEVSPFVKLSLGRLMIDWGFENLDLAAIFGITPAPHEQAVRFVRLLGLDLFGPIPGASAWRGSNSAAYISAMTREQWRSRRDHGTAHFKG